MTAPFTPLPIEFERGRRTFIQIRRNERYALYRLEEPGWPSPSFEVIHIRLRPAGTVFGKAVEPRESYPSNEDFGRYGWTCLAESAAQARFDRLSEALGRANEVDGGGQFDRNEEKTNLGMAGPFFGIQTTFLFDQEDGDSEESPDAPPKKQSPAGVNGAGLVEKSEMKNPEFGRDSSGCQAQAIQGVAL